MKWLIILLLGWMQTIHAFGWQDLWATKDQQAKVMMEKGQVEEAKNTFTRSDWQAASAYRAGDYERAATLYKSFKNEEAYYNQGNALAHMGDYKQALKAYDKALRINPDHQDALHNRKIVEELLKKQKEQQKQDKENQDKQNQDKQNQDKQDQDKQNQDKQNPDKQNQDKQNQDKQNQDKQNQDKQNQDKQNQDKQNQDKQNQDKQNKNKNDSEKKSPASAESQSPAQREKQQAKEQWLRLIPDDPGGLMREKFLRDHLRRERGWEQ